MENQPDEVRQLAEQASKQGMVLVDHSNIEPLLKEYKDVMEHADKLLAIEDPVEKPYESKYAARKELDALANKLEANATVLKLEGKTSVVKDEVNWRVAAIRVKTGSIAWDVEEPHNTEQDLEAAAEMFFPGLVSHFREAAPDLKSTESADREQLDRAVLDTRSQELLTVTFDPAKSLCDALRCLNLLGILWNGRENVLRGALFLKSSEEIFERLARDDSPLAHVMELRDVYTHTLFYLAQCYGNLGDAGMSSQYCAKTLQRQLDSGLSGGALADWVKNAMSLADYFFASEDFPLYAHVLRVCELLLSRQEEEVLCEAGSTAAAPVPPAVPETDMPPAPPSSGSPPSTAMTPETRTLRDMQADLCRRWIRLEVECLEVASAWHRYREGGVEGQIPERDVSPLSKILPNQGRFIGVEAYCGAGVGEGGAEAVAQTPKLITPEEIRDGESAKALFLRCAGRIEQAKKAFPLDGFVTDHIHLLQEHSKLYRALAVFDADPKRQQAMTNRRVEMLKPMLSTLSRASFDNAHKMIAYELGEAYMLLWDIKTSKYRDPATDELHLWKMKAVERTKCNAFCLGAIHLFAHFTSMYRSNERSQSCGGNGLLVEVDPASDLTTQMAKGCTLLCMDDVDTAFITGEEVRPFLNAHFLAARMVGRIVDNGKTGGPAGAPSPSVQGSVLSLDIYRWLVKKGPGIAKKKETSTDEVFHEEFKICKEMVELLPAKIDRMHYNAEGPNAFASY